MEPVSLLKTQQAANYLALSVTTLEKYRVYGGGPSFVRLGRAVRYRTADLNAWLESRVRTSTSDNGHNRQARECGIHPAS